ncbi:hypothetical protein ASE63_25235 [Bosea sp. Root381]|uniref:hypothetical protein n=1 Tax=Bosea sp. Root381 TaxID=1736524 RepID=UPI0006F7255E|nr:hypothetical protein [Bosea sp. Root381]KRE04918.1 hypothetical protein ASE63_25235 [Bosea sp. Root381]
MKDQNMTNAHPRQPANAGRLNNLVVDNTERPVIDELTALRLHDPSMADYAALIRNPPAIGAITARAKHHADQSARFVELVSDSDQEAFGEHVGQLVALALLNNMATLAAALLPALTGPDRHARREQGHAFIDSLDRPQDNPLREVAKIAFGMRDIDAAEIANDAIAFAAAGRAPAAPGQATLHDLEEQATLRGWLAAEINIGGLQQEARRHAQMAIRFSKSLRDDELGHADHDLTQAAREGAILQHAITLACLAISPKVPNARTLVQPISDEMTGRPQVRAALELAMEMGDHLRQLAASYPATSR